MVSGVKKASTVSAESTTTSFGNLCYGPIDLKVGWRLAIFVAIVACLWILESWLVRTLPWSNTAATYLTDKTLKFGIFLIASWIMGRFESRTISQYGLPWRKMFGRQFWLGAGMALVGLMFFLLVLRAVGVYSFGTIAISTGAIWKWGCLYGIGFAVVALEEEFHYRGYVLYTLAQGIGFWPAATVTSALFGYSHLGNAGETWTGLFNAGAGGLLFCLLLRRSGNLWMPIGFHTSWDWTQTYLCGIPDSGQVLPGHLLSGVFSGPSWLTGGAVGPEGSLLLTVWLFLFWVGICLLFKRSAERTSDEGGRLGGQSKRLSSSVDDRLSRQEGDLL